MAATDKELFRAVRKDEFTGGVIVDGHAVAGVLYPAFEDKQYVVEIGGRMEGKVKPADVHPYPFEGQVVIDTGGGTSLFDRSAVFGTKHWHYFRIPAGTDIPTSLKVRFTGANERFKANLYQIEPAGNRMSIVAYKGALDSLARNAVKKMYENAR